MPAPVSFAFGTVALQRFGVLSEHGGLSPLQMDDSAGL
jgi:hypothetical protein